MIESMDTLTGTPCPLCGEPIGSGFAVHEVGRDTYAVICVACDLVVDAGEGK